MFKFKNKTKTLEQFFFKLHYPIEKEDVLKGLDDPNSNPGSSCLYFL